MPFLFREGSSIYMKIQVRLKAEVRSLHGSRKLSYTLIATSSSYWWGSSIFLFDFHFLYFQTKSMSKLDHKKYCSRWLLLLNKKRKVKLAFSLHRKQKRRKDIKVKKKESCHLLKWEGFWGKALLFLLYIVDLILLSFLDLLISFKGRLSQPPLVVINQASGGVSEGRAL